MIRAAALILSLFSAPVVPETIDPGNGAPVDLASFECRDINRSTVVQRVC